MANFGQKPWTKPFGKIPLFSTFLTFCFYRQEKRFFTLQYHNKLFFRPILPNKKMMLKWPILDKNYRLSLWKKLNF